MELKAAKELAHIRSWLGRVDEIVSRGQGAYLADVLLQEAGDSLMMKLGEAANRCPDSVSWRRTVSSGRLPSRIATSSFISTTRSTASSLG